MTSLPPAAAVLEPYQYTPLPADTPSAFRLLRVHPSGNTQDPIVCDLRIDSLDAKPQYAALSYTWGPPVFDQQVICNGKEIMITKGLSRALRAFRDEKWQMIWVDQICINQQDPEEQGRQILLMKRIYEGCIKVFAYLGDGGGQGWLGVVVLQTLAHMMRNRKNLEDATLHYSQLVKLQSTPGFEFELKPMFDIFTSPYFRRAWIIQEAATCPEIGFIYAGKHIYLETLISAAASISRTLVSGGGRLDGIDEDAARDVWRGLHHLIQMHELRDQLRLSKKSPKSEETLGDLLISHMSAEKEATNPRDRIYALLSLASDVDRLPKPDYRKEVEVIFHEFAREMIFRNQELLLMAGLENQSLQLPSWVPDWTSVRKLDSARNLIDARGSLYRGDGRHLGIHNFFWNRNSFLRAGPALDELLISGFLADTILMTGIQMPGLSQPSSLGPQWFAQFREWDEVARDIMLAEPPKPGCVEASQRMALYAAFLASDACPLVPYIQRSPSLAPVIKASSVDITMRKVIAREPVLDTYTTTKANHPAWGAPEVPDYRTSMTDVETYYWRTVEDNLAERAFGMTEKGYLSLIPGCALRGDRILIVPNLRNPLVVRKSGQGYKLVGDCYVTEYERHPDSDLLPFEEYILC